MSYGPFIFRKEQEEKVDTILKAFKINLNDEVFATFKNEPVTPGPNMFGLTVSCSLENLELLLQSLPNRVS